MQTLSLCSPTGSRDPNRMVRLTTASRLFQIPDRTLRHYARKGHITARRQGRRAWLVRLGDVDRILAIRATRVM
jgi:DNA-binding transcriptional MerR regulator